MKRVADTKWKIHLKDIAKMETKVKIISCPSIKKEARDKIEAELIAIMEDKDYIISTD